MTYEQHFFIQVLREHLSGAETKTYQKIDWKTVLFLAQIHQVEGIVFYQCKKLIPSEYYAYYNQKFSATLFYYKNRERALKDIESALIKNGVSCFSVKGLGIASCYPIPSLRTMGDLDIMVHRADKEKAGGVLESLGYEQYVDKGPEYDWGYQRNNIHIELHHLLFYDEPVMKHKQINFFKQCWNYVENGRLDWSFHFLFILAHLRKHMVFNGAGLRLFLDLAAIVKNDPGLDWKWIEEKLELLDMRKFSQICFALCDKWFGIKAPIRSVALSDDFFEVATETVLDNGVFGFNNERNKNNAAINSILKHGRVRSLSRVQMVIGYVFPKYKHMQHISHYSFLEGRPWLLPIAWTYRFIRMLNGKTDSISNFTGKVSIPNSEIDEREEILKRWDLLE